MNPTRLFEFLEFQVNNQPLEKTLSTKYADKWISISSNQFLEEVEKISLSLIKMGVKKGDKIALISTNNRTEWCIMDLAILQLGAITVPIYPTITAKEYKYILNHSESIYCFVSDKVIYDKINQIRNEITTIKEIFSFDLINYCKSWTLLKSEDNSSYKKDLISYKKKVNPEDIATIIYTSGTTGTPKGVMLSHGNIVSNVLSSSKKLPLDIGNSKALSFLPVCHIFERVILYVYYYNSVEIHFAESLETISENLNEVCPNFMTAVPRLLEKLYDKIYAKGSTLNGIKKKLFYWAVDLGLKYQPYRGNGIFYELKLAIARKLIFSKWKKAMGGNLEIICSGSAALQPRLARVFTAAGITIAEGYGLTETSPVLTVSDLRNNSLKIGYVGKPIDGVKIKIAKDGEILCKGPNVMKGYYKDPKKTAEVIKNGYFHTGDIGFIDKEGFLKITDRKKQLFKTSGGKYIAPQLIENQMKQSLFIEQIIVIGEGQKMPAAIIQPSFEYVNQWAIEKNIKLHDEIESICNNNKLIETIQKEIDFYNDNFSQWEKIKKFKLTPEVWSIELGHLTPTMKIKRRIVEEKYKELIDKIYE
ncbi:MAG: long-chain fatty acid--CoA ligase [Flavobacteriaceae bacterium]|nr:long-chain fatty acid--CoA ligase [Flavobacteriaceae bacterium]